MATPTAVFSLHDSSNGVQVIINATDAMTYLVGPEGDALPDTAIRNGSPDHRIVGIEVALTHTTSAVARRASRGGRLAHWV